MIKVLYITNYPPPYAVAFFREFGKRCDLTVTFDRRPNDVNYRSKEWFSSVYQNFRAVFLKQKKIGNKIFCPEIKKYLKSDFDAVIMGEYATLTEMYAIFYMKRHKIPYCFAIDGGMKKDGRGIKEKIKRYLVSGASLYLSSGEVTDEFLCFYGAKRERIVRYPFTPLTEEDILSVPLNDDKKKAFRSNLGITEERIVLSVGQFIHRKGFDILMRAAKNISENTGVYIVGAEAPQEYLDLKERLELKNVHFVGFTPKEKLKEYYLASDVFVLPTREDNWGLVINEAMGYGLPVVTTDKCVAGMELIENGEGGYIVPVEDEKELGEKIVKILSDDALRAKMSERNLRKISGYTIKNMAERHFEEIRKLVEQ